jgi:glycosyltransferase involved in cell wall biosynthesis
MSIRIINILEEGRYGGPQKRTTLICAKMDNIEFEVLVVFPRNESKLFYEKLSIKGIKNKRIDLHRLTKQKAHLVKYIALFIAELFALYKLFKKEHVDIVQCNGSWQIKGVIAGALSGAKVVWFLNDTQMPRLLRIVFKNLALIYCDAIIANGNRAKKYYLHDLGLLSMPFDVIQSPVDTTLFDPEKVEEDQKITGYPGLKIVTVGNINPLKGIEYFVEMVSILNQQYNNLIFFVIGPHFDSQAQYSKKLSGLAKSLKTENLHFYGPSDNIPSVLKAADVYVCLSIAEASPISVWEAMSMEKAIVSTDVGDVANFIKDGESGYVVPIKNAPAMAEKVGLFIENANLRKKVGTNARNIAVKHLDVDICAKKHTDFYIEIAKMK